MDALAVLLLVVASILILSVLSSRLSLFIGVPTLLVYLVLGMLLGSDGPGGVEFADYEFARDGGILALIYILYAGGLETRLERIRPAIRSGLMLSIPGTIITASLLAGLVYLLLGLSVSEAMLIGAIVSSTDAAAVFNILRGGSTLKGNIRETLELESSSNDPVAIALTLVALASYSGEDSVLRLLWQTPLQIVLGIGFGYALGRLSVKLLNSLHLEYDGLYIVIYVALAPFIFGLSSVLYGNGFLAVFVAAVTIGNSRAAFKRSAVRFMDGAIYLINIACFLLLGLLVFPASIPSILLEGIVLGLLMVFIVRPLAVYMVLIGSGLDWRSKLLISWAGLRGAAPIILATFPVALDFGGADRIFNIVFFVVLFSLLVQGSTVGFLARWLGLSIAGKPRSFYPFEFENREHSDTRLEEFIVPYSCGAAGRALMDIEFPEDALVVMIARGESYIAPTGRTEITGGDVLLVLVNDRNEPEIRKLILQG